MSIYLPLKKLSYWQQAVFSAALIERMLPNYAMFSTAVGFGEVQVMRNQLDLIWQRLAKKPAKVNFEAQLNKLEEQVPEVDNFDFFGVYAALDVCMAMMSLLQGCEDKTVENFEQVSKLSYNSTSGYVELLLSEEGFEEITEPMLKDHPLLQWEKATQFELFDFIKDAAENEDSCKKAKKIALEEGLTNLGIEIT